MAIPILILILICMFAGGRKIVGAVFGLFVALVCFAIANQMP